MLCEFVMITAQSNEIIIIKPLVVVLSKRHYVMHRQLPRVILQDSVILLRQTYPTQVHIPCLDIF